MCACMYECVCVYVCMCVCVCVCGRSQQRVPMQQTSVVGHLADSSGARAGPVLQAVPPHNNYFTNNNNYNNYNYNNNYFTTNAGGGGMEAGGGGQLLLQQQRLNHHQHDGSSSSQRNMMMMTGFNAEATMMTNDQRSLSGGMDGDGTTMGPPPVMMMGPQGGPPAASTVQLPSCSRWFDTDKVHDVEREQLYVFFAGYPGLDDAKREDEYLKIRNAIVHKYRQNVSRHLTVTDCRRIIDGDAALLLRLHSFLDYWGIINFQADPATVPSQSRLYRFEICCFFVVTRAPVIAASNDDGDLRSQSCASRPHHVVRALPRL
eukprot:GHVU01018121.1.p1 GENE.GHVU01018121.1~~GHVU01018121.1.p1  ORF type:complete len:318 (+),score=77.10 GHVU01018121.1:161-1114(+)